MSTADNTNKVASSVGDKLKGVFGAVHGGGETLRGTINSTLDGLGDAIAGRKTGAAGGESETTAHKGIAEVKESVHDITKSV